MSIKVLIADDHPLLRYGLTAYLEGQPDIRVVAQADDGDQVLPEIARAYPDVLANRLTSVDSVPYTSDAKFAAGKPGNLLSDGAYTYTYNHANQLVGVSGAGTTVSYGYNGQGDRVSQTVGITTTNFTLDLAAGLTQVLSDGTDTYLYGNGRIAQSDASGAQYFLGDALGSVRQLVDVNGDVLLAQSYEPYGEVLASVGEGESSYGFAAEMRDSYIKLIYLLSREYSPATGRFLTEDSWRGDYTRPLSLNGWNYVEGNPVNRIDPTGHISEKQAADADKIVAYLKSTYNIAIRKDWGWRLFATVLYNSISILPPNCQFHWETGNWQSIDELKVTRSTIINVGEKMGGVQKFKSAMEERPVSMVRVLTLPSGASGMAPPYIGAVTGDILLADTTFNRDTVDARFTIAHELAHVWDWRSGQALSNGLVKLLGGECLEDVFHGTTVCKYDPWAREDPPGSKNPDDNYASRDSWEDWADTFATYMYPQYYGKFNWNNGLSPIRRKYVIRQIQAIR